MAHDLYAAQAEELVGFDPVSDTWKFVDVPWFCPVRVDHANCITPFVIDGDLPGGIPLGVTSSWDWQRRIAVPTTEMKPYAFADGGTPITLGENDRKIRWIRMAYLRMGSATSIPVPDGWQFDVSRVWEDDDYAALRGIAAWIGDAQGQLILDVDGVPHLSQRDFIFSARLVPDNHRAVGHPPPRLVARRRGDFPEGEAVEEQLRAPHPRFLRRDRTPSP